MLHKRQHEIFTFLLLKKKPNLTVLDLLSVTVWHHVQQGISIIMYSRVFYLCSLGLISRLPGQSGRTRLDSDDEKWKEGKRKRGRKLRQTGIVIWVHFWTDEKHGQHWGRAWKSWDKTKDKGKKRKVAEVVGGSFIGDALEVKKGKRPTKPTVEAQQHTNFISKYKPKSKQMCNW